MQMHAGTTALGLAFCLIGCGMVYVTWIRPKSRLRRVFCARWRPFGPEASKFGAATQVFTLLTLGLPAVVSGLGISVPKLAFVPILLGLVASGTVRIAELRDDETSR